MAHSPPRSDEAAASRPTSHQDLLSGILDATQLVVYLKDVDGRYLFVNRQYEKVSAVPREFIVGKRDEELFPADTAKRFLAQDAEVIARRALIEFEETIDLPGGVYSFITGKFPLIDASGHVYAVGGFCTDITSRKNRAEESLAAERERLAVTLRCIGEGILSTDTDGKVLSMNPSAEHLTGTRQIDAVGRSVEEMFRTHEGAELPGLLVRNAVESRRVAHSATDVLVTPQDGSKHFLAATAAPVEDRTGSLIGAVLSLRDMTEQRRITEALFQARNMQSVGTLARGIAHDYNNLLTGILGNVGLMREALETSPTATMLAREVESACQRAMMLSEQLMTFARGAVPVRKPLALGPLVEGTTRLVLSGSPVAGIVEIADDLWTIDGDEGQLVQAVSNLLVNAKEAMPQGGTVTLRAENLESSGSAPGRRVRLTVTDNGPGMPDHVIASVFDPYFSTKNRGSGLGLSIVFSVVGRHDGHVAVESVVGTGTTFKIDLPASTSVAAVS
ncbi:MAG: PAS domain-containing protein, partial [Deltaproteobacteria bacterium]